MIVRAPRWKGTALRGFRRRGVGDLNCPGDPGCPGYISPDVNEAIGKWFDTYGGPSGVMTPAPVAASSSWIAGISNQTVVLGAAGVFLAAVLFGSMRR